jgi:DNA-binding CsgD family transcriptional regulator
MNGLKERVKIIRKIDGNSIKNLLTNILSKLKAYQNQL